MRPTWEGALHSSHCWANHRMSRVTYWKCIHLSVGVTTSEMSSSSLRYRVGRECWRVWTLWYSTVLPYTSYSPKRVNICPGSLRYDLWFHSYPQLGNQWSMCAKGLPEDRPHLCKSALFCHHCFFLSSVRWDQNSHLIELQIPAPT